MKSNPKKEDIMEFVIFVVIPIVVILLNWVKRKGEKTLQRNDYSMMTDEITERVMKRLSQMSLPKGD